MVLQKANAPLVRAPNTHALIRRRLALLTAIMQGGRRLLVSRRLLREYGEHVLVPRNDTIRAFFEIVTRGDRVVWNWPKWGGAEREVMGRCRFPREDEHVLRTAVRGTESTVFTEENRMLRTSACVHRRLRVRITAP